MHASHSLQDSSLHLCVGGTLGPVFHFTMLWSFCSCYKINESSTFSLSFVTDLMAQQSLCKAAMTHHAAPVGPCPSYQGSTLP